MARRKKSSEKGCLWGLFLLCCWPFYLIYLLIKALVKAAASGKSTPVRVSPQKEKQKTNTRSPEPVVEASPVTARKDEQKTNTRLPDPAVITPPAPAKREQLPKTAVQHSETTILPQLPKGFIFVPKPDLSYRWTEEDRKKVQGMTDYCVLDVETTGLDYKTDRIVQLSILRVEGDSIAETFTTMVNPGHPIPARATAIHGITDADVKDAPKYEDIADRVYELLNGQTVVGHNVTFDLNFTEILMLAGENADKDLDIDYIDTWQYSRVVVRGMPDYKLQTLLAHFEIDPGKAHTADADTLATFELFKRLRYEDAHAKEIAAAKRREAREQEAAERQKKYGASPLFDRNVYFAGAFSVSREAIEELAKSVGAKVRYEVNGRTAFVVKGDTEAQSGLGTVQNLQKAEDLGQAGKPVKIIGEAEFFSLVSDAKKCMEKARE